MSLAATHIRFALDLKGRYEVGDLKKYISGTVYPDSRYVSGISRDLTHGPDFLAPEFAADDFRKGWQAHLLCDRIHNQKKQELFPDIFPVYHDSYDEQNWLVSSALKIIQDRDDVQAFDIRPYLEMLAHVENPNNEDLEAVRKSNEIALELYRGKTVPSVDDYMKMWQAFGVSEKHLVEIRRKTEMYLQNADIVERVKGVYTEMINSDIIKL